MKNKLTRAELERSFEKTKNELALLSEITNDIMQSLDLDQILYTILTAITSHDALEFDRAMFFLVNNEKQTLEGKMALGPDDPKLELLNISERYDKFRKGPDTKLNSLVKSISIPLDENAAGALALTVLEGMPLEISTEKAESMVTDDVKRLLNLDRFATVPLKTEDKALGVIVVDNILSHSPITKDNIRTLNLFADHAALAIENSHLYQKYVRLSRTDWLTGLWNTRYFNEILQTNIENAQKEESCLSLLIIDIDNFKKYNDSLGHQRGDDAIRKVAYLLNRYSRRSDFACRYGGEEFCVIMLKIKRHEARTSAERLRLEVENTFKFDTSVPANLKLTISLGLAIFPEDGMDKDKLIHSADLALYHAKRNGKNQVCIYSPDLSERTL